MFDDIQEQNQSMVHTRCGNLHCPPRSRVHAFCERNIQGQVSQSLERSLEIRLSMLTILTDIIIKANLPDNK